MIPVHRTAPALLALVLVGVAALVCGCLAPETAIEEVAWNLTLAGEEEEKVLTLAEVRALSPDEGYGYSVSTVGIKYGPNRYRGVLLAGLIDMTGGAGGDALITAPPLRVILAYEQDGEPLAYGDGGPLRLVVITETPDVITEGSPWVKWVDRVEVKSG